MCTLVWMFEKVTITVIINIFFSLSTWISFLFHFATCWNSRIFLFSFKKSFTHLAVMHVIWILFIVSKTISTSLIVCTLHRIDTINMMHDTNDKIKKFDRYRNPNIRLYLICTICFLISIGKWLSLSILHTICAYIERMIEYKMYRIYAV